MIFQINGGLLELFVLSVCERADTYGYKLTQQITTKIPVSDSTLYPVLRRLGKEGMLETYDQPVDGRNRRYYKITDQGRLHLDQMRHEWMQDEQTINSIVFGGNNHD